MPHAIAGHQRARIKSVITTLSSLSASVITLALIRSTPRPIPSLRPRNPRPLPLLELLCAIDPRPLLTLVRRLVSLRRLPRRPRGARGLVLAAQLDARLLACASAVS